jgi:hypothetical protein
MMNVDQRQALLCLGFYNLKDNLTQSHKGRRGKPLKGFHHRDTEGTEKFKKQRTYNPNKGCKDLTRRRKGVEKAHKENHFKKQEHHPLRLSWLFLAFLR